MPIFLKKKEDQNEISIDNKEPIKIEEIKSTRPVFIEKEPVKCEKPKWTWMVFLLKLKLYFDPCSLGKVSLKLQI